MACFCLKLKFIPSAPVGVIIGLGDLAEMMLKSKFYVPFLLETD